MASFWLFSTVTHPDLDLAQLVCRRDSGATETMVRRYQNDLWILAYRFLRDMGLAEDAVQETWIKALRAICAYRGESSLLTWLSTICRRHCIDQLSSPRQREVAAEIVPIEWILGRREVTAYELKVIDGALQGQRGAGGGWEDHVIDRMTFLRVLNALPPNERKAAILVCVQGFSRQEAAELLKLPPSTVRTWVSRFKRQVLEEVDAAQAGSGALEQ